MIASRRMRWCIWLSSSLLGASGLVAEESAAPKKDLYKELEWIRAEGVTVSTASLHDETIAHAPATIRVITQKQIRDRGYRSLYELLRDLPGFDVLDHAQAESKNRVAIRGITGNTKFLILQDGIRIGTPTGEAITPILENFPLYMAKQVEVLYGPASAIYGADAFTGVINIITRDPTPEGIYEAALEGGEFDSYRAEFYAAKRINDAFAYSFGGHVQETEGADLADAYPDLYQFDDLKTFDGRVVIPVEDRKPYSAPYHSFSTWAKFDIGENFVFGWNQSLFGSSYFETGSPVGADYGSDGGDTLLITTYGKYFYEIGDRISGQVQANYSRYEQDPHSTFKNRITEYQATWLYSLGERFQVEPQIRIAVNEVHTLTAGLTLERFHAIPHTTDLPERYDRGKDPDDQNMFHIGTDNTLPIENFELYYNNYGGFVQEQAQWTEKLSTTLGLRYDYNQDYGETWNPRIGLVYQPSDQTTWKALYGQAYIAPSPLARYEEFGIFAYQRPDGLYQSFFFHVPNPDLEPEELQTVELSVLHEPWEHFELGAAAFYTEADDVILSTRTPEPVTDFIPGGYLDFTEAAQNVGEVESYGFELTANQAFERDLTRCNLWGSFSYVDGQLDNNLTEISSDLPFTSGEMVKLGVTLNYNNRVTFTPILRWNGPQAGLTEIAGKEVETSDFTVVDLYAELRSRSQRWAVYLRVTNLFDERYYNGNRNIENLSNFEETPQDPRWVTAGLRMTL